MGPLARARALGNPTSASPRRFNVGRRAAPSAPSFDAAFDLSPHWRVVKEIFTQIWGTPKGHRASKPFFDHVFNFAIADGKVWFRNYQVDVAEGTGTRTGDPREASLIEVGPRMVLDPIRLFAGGFGGPTLWQNMRFVHPNAVRL